MAIFATRRRWSRLCASKPFKEDHFSDMQQGKPAGWTSTKGGLLQVMFVNPHLYPTDPGFIRVLGDPEQRRVRQLGFFDDTVILFEIPFCATSGAWAGIARDYSQKCFYEFFACTEGVIAALSDEQLRVVVDHEADEIRESIARVTDPAGGPGLVTRESEAQRHRAEIEALNRRYGERLVTETLMEVQRVASCHPLLPRYIAGFWLVVFLNSNSTRFGKFAHEMHEPMLTSHSRAIHRDLLNQVKKEYGERMPMDAFRRLWHPTVSGMVGNE